MRPIYDDQSVCQECGRSMTYLDYIVYHTCLGCASPQERQEWIDIMTRGDDDSFDTTEIPQAESEDDAVLGDEEPEDVVDVAEYTEQEHYADTPGEGETETIEIEL